MQTFMPYANFYKSLNCLDYKRLGKQRSEAYIILKNITGNFDGWSHHPTIKMWSGYDDALRLYMNMCIKLWIKRGYKNNMALNLPKFKRKKRIKLPPWFGNEKFHKSHREALLFKNFDYYYRYFYNEKPQIQYYWPI
ncbi:MAG: MSMEG_6728 family protein [Candidatus Gastranaerophilales bacterium]|nr:MSMEG_6728 family protein [Candidatus Gastranaerophilales bacterium]